VKSSVNVAYADVATKKFHKKQRTEMRILNSTRA